MGRAQRTRTLIDQPRDQPRVGLVARARASALIGGDQERAPGIGVEAIRFVLVGATDTIVQFGIFNLLLWVGLPAVAATACGVVLATANSYVLNRLWTFGHRRRGDVRREFPVFAFINLIGLGITLGVVAACSQALGGRAGLGSHAHGVHNYIVLNGILLGATGLSGLFRFVAMRRWVFPPRDTP